ncbi:MAG: glycosyl hydrolase [Actinomycetota bacterium]
MSGRARRAAALLAVVVSVVACGGGEEGAGDVDRTDTSRDTAASTVASSSTPTAALLPTAPPTNAPFPTVDAGGTTTASTETAATGTGSTGSTGTGSTGTGPPGSVMPQPLVGVAVKRGNPDLVEQIAAAADARLGMVRVFARWDTPFPDAGHQRLLDAGYDLHLSVRPRTDDRRIIPWRAIAEADEGEEAHDRLRWWLEQVAGHDGRILFTLNHEPETTDSAPNGTAEEYVAAWRRMDSMLASVDGGDAVSTVFVVSRGPYANGKVEEWYPGDDVVDVIGVDAYNWFDCQGTDRPWTEPAELLAPVVDFADARGKPLIVGEIASTEDPDDPDRKAAWIRRLDDLLAGPLAGTVTHLAWFDVDDPVWPDCRWRHDSSPAAADAFAALLRNHQPPSP